MQKELVDMFKLRISIYLSKKINGFKECEHENDKVINCHFLTCAREIFCIIVCWNLLLQRYRNLCRNWHGAYDNLQIFEHNLWAKINVRSKEIINKLWFFFNTRK